MTAHERAAIRRGMEAGVLAGIPQVLLPKLEEALFLEDGESVDLGPLFMEALARRAGAPLPEDYKWLGASVFHFGYSAFWGGLYARVYERRPVPPWIGGLTMGSLIYLVTFPRWGAAVLVGTEPLPRERSWRMELVLATAPLTFGLCTALLYGRGPRRTLRDALVQRWRALTSS